MGKDEQKTKEPLKLEWNAPQATGLAWGGRIFNHSKQSEDPEGERKIYINQAQPKFSKRQTSWERRDF